MTAAVSY